MLLVNRRLGPKSDHVKTTRIIHNAQRTCTRFAWFPTLAFSFKFRKFRHLTHILPYYIRHNVNLTIKVLTFHVTTNFKTQLTAHILPWSFSLNVSLHLSLKSCLDSVSKFWSFFKTVKFQQLWNIQNLKNCQNLEKLKNKNCQNFQNFRNLENLPKCLKTGKTKN